MAYDHTVSKSQPQTNWLIRATMATETSSHRMAIFSTYMHVRYVQYINVYLCVFGYRVCLSDTRTQASFIQINANKFSYKNNNNNNGVEYFIYMK